MPRRALRFETLDEMLQEVERLCAVEQSGKLQRSGNWTLGQALGHLAAWINYAYEGYPFRSAPWFVRLFVKLQRKRLLNKGLPAGMRLSGVPGGTYAIDPLPTGEGATRLEAAVARLQRGEAPRHPSPAMGACTPNELVLLNLRHAELHLSHFS